MDIAREEGAEAGAPCDGKNLSSNETKRTFGLSTRARIDLTIPGEGMGERFGTGWW